MTRLIASTLAVLCCFGSFAFDARGQVYEQVLDLEEAREADAANAINLGRLPAAELVEGSDGTFYGTTAFGGTNGLGTVFKMTPAGKLTTLVEFTGNGASNRGASPYGRLVEDSDGNFYGTTTVSGNGYGTIFRMTRDGVLTTVAEFSNNGTSNKGSSPWGRLAPYSDGTFYGTTLTGGPNNFGTIFKVTPSGTLTTLVIFTGTSGAAKGARPHAGLVLGNDGNFYGTTTEGGAGNFGTIFKMTPSGELTTLLEFTSNGASNKGSAPYSELMLGEDGNFYGTTFQGGTSGFGTVYRVTPEGVLTTLVNFTSNGAINKGAFPYARLLKGDDGSFYGTAYSGGTNVKGTVFKVTPSGELTTLVNFTGTGAFNRGSNAMGGLIKASGGGFYGTTNFGGANNCGTIFRITATGVLATLVEFVAAPSDKGKSPRAGLVQGSDGQFYGTTHSGGVNGFGTVFKMSSGGVVTTLVSFNAGVDPKGNTPIASVVQGDDGNFYGTTYSGGINNLGTVFRMTPAGELTTLVDISVAMAPTLGKNPRAELCKGSDGNFYGTMSMGGSNDFGTVFRVTPTGVITTLVHFTDTLVSRGRNPQAGLMQDSDGNFYGTTYGGGAFGAGTIFKMTPSGALTTLVDLNPAAGSNHGQSPQCILVKGSDGNFYGTATFGGTYGLGTVFKMTPDGQLSSLTSFAGTGTPTKGSNPMAGLILAADGNFYGTTPNGGAMNDGTVFRITPAGVLTTLHEFLGAKDGSHPVGALAVAADGDLYGVTQGEAAQDDTIFRLVVDGAPTAVANGASFQSATEVLLQAQINARGQSTDVSLEYGTSEADLSHVVSLASGMSGYRTRIIGTALGDLNVGTVYYYRFRAVSSAGTALTPVLSFSTLAEPVVSVDAADEIAPTSARFHGTANARNFDTLVSFEWGTDGNSFPHSVAAAPGIVTGSTDTPVSAAVAGLPQGGTVFFRVRATSAGGTVISGVRSFSTVSVTTTNPLPEQVGVTDAVFRATINTFGQTASVKFKYWADAAPGVIFETAAQTVTSSGPKEVTATVTDLQENVAYSYRVSVELAGTETEGDAVAFATETNAAPVAANDLVFYAGQVVVDPLANDTDPNDGTSASLMLDPVLVVPPNASLGVASVTSDRRFISYNPQFNVRDDDSLTYRVVDPLGASAQAQVRLIAFSKRAGLYGGKIVFGSGASGREGQVAVQMGGGGAISTSFMNWPDATERLGESFVLKGVFDQRGRFSRTLNSPSGAVLTLSLQLDADLPQMHGVFEERVNGASTTGEIAFTLTLNAGTGGLAGSGLRTGFLSPPTELGALMASGFVRMTVGKDAKRGARFAGRLPDGEPFLASAKAQGRTYELTRKLEQGGLFTGLVRALDGTTGASGMMGDLYWQKRANSRAKFYRGGVETMLSLSGAAYPALAKNALPPIGLGMTSPNARLRLSGGDLPGAYRDLLLNILPGGAVQIVGSDPMQTGADIPTNKLQIKVDAPKAAFTGRFLHPATGKAVTFEGAFRVPFDEESGQGCGVFRGPNTAGAVQVLVP